MTNKLIVTWQDLETLTRKIYTASKEASFTPEFIVGISRGGLVPATILSHMFQRPLIPLVWATRDYSDLDYQTAGRIWRLNEEYAAILVVDDICDTGKTFETLQTYLQRDQDAPVDWQNVRYASLHYRHSCTFNCLYAQKVEDDAWVEYPYEIDAHPKQML